jgi:hypothetical protein
VIEVLEVLVMILVVVVRVVCVVRVVRVVLLLQLLFCVRRIGVMIMKERREIRGDIYMGATEGSHQRCGLRKVLL